MFCLLFGLPCERLRLAWPPPGRWVFGLALVSGWLMPAQAELTAHNDTQARERAVQAARAGRLDEAIESLTRLTEHVEDPSIRHDLLVILNWRGRHADAVAWWDRLAPSAPLPDYVKQALIGSLLQVGDTARASRMATQWQAQAPDHAPALLTAGEVARWQGRWLDALRLQGEAALQGADPQRVRAEQIRLLTELGGHQGAAWLSQVPSLAQQANRAAMQLRLAGRLAPVTPAQGQARLDAVLMELDRLMTELDQAAPALPVVRRQVLGDRALARSERGLWQAALNDVKALAQLEPDLPVHVRKAEGAAWMGLKQPQAARRAYEAVLARDPQDAQAQWGLVYALADLKEWGAAINLADRITAQHRLRLGSAKPQSDADWMYARLTSLRLRAWSDALAPSWQGLQQLVQDAPDHAGARAALAAVASARGWPRRADEEWRIARTLDDGDTALRLGALESALQRTNWAELQSGLEQLAQDHPNHPGLPALRRQMALRQGYELTAHAHQRAEPASAGASPGSSHTQGIRLYGPLQDGRWRLFTWSERTAAQKPGVFVAERRRTGGGFRIEDPDGRFEAAVWQDEGSLTGTGASLEIGRSFGDHWRGSAGISSASADVPLRAVASGIRAQSAQWSVEHAWHESASTSLSWQGLNFSDGNQRHAWHWNALAGMLNAPGWRLALQPSVGGSRNQRSDGPYFSPAWDAYVQLAWVSERHFLQGAHRRWRERVVLQAGRYQQSGFDALPIADLGYELNVGLSDAFEVGAGVVRLRRVYDGKAEMATTGQLRLQARF